MPLPADFSTQIWNRAQLGNRNRMYNEAGESCEQLQVLARKIAKQCSGKVLVGSVKSLERATQKVDNDYGGDWTELKDLVRVTIVVPFASMLWRVGLTIQEHCSQAHTGMAMLKTAETIAPQDVCGYSGLNFVVRLKNGRPGEIQVNTLEMLYAKMSPDKFKEKLGEWEYYRIKFKYGLEGGLGHALYEIYRREPWSHKGIEAASLSRMYYDCFRSGRECSRVKFVQMEINKFKPKMGMYK